MELPDLQPLGVPCKQCKEKEAIVNLPAHRLKLCKECFEAFFENRVKRTVKSYRMFGPGQRVGVLLSGGKDSSALLAALKQLRDLRIKCGKNQLYGAHKIERRYRDQFSPNRLAIIVV